MGLLDLLKTRYAITHSDSSEIDIVERHNKQLDLYKHALSIAAIVIGLMGYAMMDLKENLVTRVELPAVIYKQSEIKVGNGWANDLYFRVWSDWLVNSTANFQPGDIKDKLNNALRFLDPAKVPSYVGSLGALNNLVLRNQISQTFVAKKVTPTFYSDTEFSNTTNDAQQIKSAIFVYTGLATQAINRQAQPDRACDYTVSIKLEGGHLYASSYNTTCFNNK